MIKSNTLKCYVLAGVIAVGFAVCLHCRHKPEPRNLIIGTVTDSLTGAPIDSAQLVIGDTLTSAKIYYTDARGRYVAHPFTSGIVEVYCRKAAYETRLRTVDLSTNLDVYRDVDFELRPR